MDVVENNYQRQNLDMLGNLKTDNCGRTCRTVIFSLEAFNELSWDDVYKIFWINLFVFFDLAATNGCFSEKVL